MEVERETDSHEAAGGLVTLTPAELGGLLGIGEEDAYVICGSGARVPAAWPAEYRSRVGSLDLTVADCAILTGGPQRAIHTLRERGYLKVRTLSASRTDGLRIAPAELVRALRHIAKLRNGTTEVVETPTQEARRLDAEHAAALAACRGE